MIGEFVRKIECLMDASKETVPCSLELLFCLIRSSLAALPSENIDVQTVELFSRLYHHYRQLFSDSPETLSFFLLTTKTFPQNHANLLQTVSVFLSQKWFISELQLNLLNFLKNLGTNEYLIAQGNKYIHLLKENPSRYAKACSFSNGELSKIFWLNNFKLEPAVNFDIFYEALAQFCKGVSIFSGELSRTAVRSVADPINKRYVSLYNCHRAFRAIFQPEFIQKSKELKESPVEDASHDMLVLMIHVRSKSERIDLDGSKLIVAQDWFQLGWAPKGKNKHSGIFRMGASEDNELTLKSKYISRRQFAILQGKNASASEATTFWLICFSQTNFTQVIYPFSVKASPALIIHSESHLIEIMDYQSNEADRVAAEVYDGATLEVIPLQKQSKEGSNEMSLKYEYINGQNKGKKGVVVIGNSTPIDKCFICEKGQFYVKAGVKMLVKNANDIVFGRLSRKIELVKGIRIVCDEFEFEI